MSLGSVPSSGRPTFDMIVSTSGVCAITDRTIAARSRASLIDTEAGNSTLIHMEPSSNSGKNSLPKKLATTPVANNSPRASLRTYFFLSKAKTNNFSYFSLHH